jgi:hypothetical protein
MDHFGHESQGDDVDSPKATLSHSELLFFYEPGFDMRLKAKLATGRLPLVMRSKSTRIAVTARFLERGFIFVVRHSSLVAATVLLCCRATLGRLPLYTHCKGYRRSFR